MTTTKENMQTWAQALINARYPPSEFITAIADLRSVAEFFSGDRSLLFGMTTSPEAFLDGASLVTSANAGVVAWFENACQRGDEELQATLYPLIDTDVAEPALVRKQREADEQRDAAKRKVLSAIPRPLEAVAKVSPSLAEALCALRASLPSDLFESHGAMLHAKKEKSLNTEAFEWLDVDLEWEELLGSDFSPVFFPFAGANGDYLGVFVLGPPDDLGVVTFYSHEEGFFFMARSLEHFRAMCVAAEKGVTRGVARARGRAPRIKNIEKVENPYTCARVRARTALL